MNSPTPRLPGGPSPDRPFAELDELLEALVEERATAAQMERVEQIVLVDKAALRRYLDYMALHGSLLWDTAQSGDRVMPAMPGAGAGSVDLAAPAGPKVPAGSPARRTWRTVLISTTAALAIVAGVFAVARPWQESGPSVASNSIDRTNGGASTQGNASSTDNPAATTAKPGIADGPGNRKDDRIARQPASTGASAAAGDSSKGQGGASADSPAIAQGTRPSDGASEKGTPGDEPGETVGNGSAREAALETVAFVDDQLRSSWETSGVQPSPVAEDAEWLRRVHLDLVGRIPELAVVEQFLKDRNPLKRSLMVERLLDDPLFVRHWTTVWTNLLIGRSASRDELRPGLERYLRERFAHNRRWDETVAELVSAEGTPEENGATGFLLAHLNNEAVPATAITAKLFLGVQLQCTQCHAHPFNDATQNQFWEFNSFFTQTERVDLQQVDPKSGKANRQVALVNQERGGPIFYETRGGVMRAAFPRFGGEGIDNGPAVNRRHELARLMLEDSQGQVARAMVNRTWEHFLGAGFTRSVDDMGPHSPPTHPAALERLTDDFVKAGYDLKQLVRWICATDAYQRSSRFVAGNAEDDPSIGNPPLFSRVYVKSMTAEQLYDSLLVATRADDTPRAAKTDLDRQRHDWIQQFVVSFDTEENDEAMTFNGTIPQALMMMNGDLVDAAVSPERGTFVERLARDEGPDVEKIRRLSLAALSRPPSTKELASFRKHLRDRTVRKPRATANETQLAEGLEDIFWALLNSNEFVLVH